MTLQQLQERRKNLENKIREHADKAKTWNAEDRQVWDRINADYDANQKKLDFEIAVRERLKAEGVTNIGNGDRSRIGRDGADLNGKPANTTSLALHGWFLNSGDTTHLVTDEHRNAASKAGINLSAQTITVKLADTNQFKAFRNSRVSNASTVGNPESAGYLVGTTLMTTLERAMLDYSGVLQVADIMRTTTGEPIEFITSDDTGNSGTRVGESALATDGTDPTVGRVRLSSYDFTSGMLYVSRTLLRDSVINFEQELGQMLGERIGRKQNTDYTTGGGGGNAPRGIVTASALGVTSSSATAIIWDEIIDLEHAIDPSRRNMPGVGYMLHDGILKYIRKLKNGNGDPIWAAGNNVGTPDTLNNRPYWINQAMQATVATATKTMLFGQLSMFKVRQVGQVTIQRLVERRAEYNQDVFIAYASGDSNLLDPGDSPVVHLLQA